MSNKPLIPVIKASEYLGDRPTPSTRKEPREMERIDPREQSYQLLTVLQAHAPTGEAQAIMAAHYNKMIGAGMDWPEIVRDLSIRLAEGLAMNNWPWHLGSETILMAVYADVREALSDILKEALDKDEIFTKLDAKMSKKLGGQS